MPIDPIQIVYFPGGISSGRSQCFWKRPVWRWLDVINPFKWIYWSWAGSLAAGVIVLIWITVETMWVPFGIVHIVYLAYGTVILGMTLLPSVRRFYSLNQG